MRRKTLVPAKRTENPPHRSALKSGNSSSWSGKGNELSGGQVVVLVAMISELVCSLSVASILLLHGVLGPLLQGLLSSCSKQGLSSSCSKQGLSSSCGMQGLSSSCSKQGPSSSCGKQGLSSSCGKQALLSGCRVRASPRGGFSCSRARAPGHTGLRSCSSGF